MRRRKIGKRFAFAPGIAVAIVLAFIAAPASPVRAQGISDSAVSVETSPQLFATMCALDAAGFDANRNTLESLPAEAALRAKLLQLQGPAEQALRQFYKRHRLASADETLSPYISFALVVGPPPQFRYLVSHDELPPDVLTIEGFDDVLRDFYTEAQLEREWPEVEPEAEQEVGRLEQPVRHIVFESTNYLREILKPSNGRTFTVFVEPQVGNRINFRNIGDHYAIVVGPEPQLLLEDIRHAFLHFLLDPLPLRYRDVVDSKRALLRIAARAPQLPAAYQDDFVGLFDECLVRAVELRLRRLPPAQREAALAGDDRSGYILVRPIYGQLRTFEKAEPAMSYYFPKLVNGIDAGAIARQFQNFQFAAATANPGSEGLHPADAEAVKLEELDQELAAGDRQIARKDAAGAAVTFDRILARYPNLPRALYGLAVASVLENRADRAEELFGKLVSQESPGGALLPGPDILAWSHVYLGRIHDLEGRREQARNDYHAALGVAGAPDAAREAAQQGLDAPYRPAEKNQPATPQK